MMKSHRLSHNLHNEQFLGEDDNYEELDIFSLTCNENEMSDSCDSEDSEDFQGFPLPEVDKFISFINFVRRLESRMTGLDLEKRDIIDGVEFLSFKSEEGLLEYGRIQEELRAAAFQSDDGLEIPDDGSFSDISSSHAIVPTKTKDITRIKGWRKKNFTAVNLCDDSASSLRNEDDGFGDDLEMKSIRSDSSEDTESVDYAARYRFGEPCSVAESSDILSMLPFENDCFNRIESSVVEDSNAVDNAEESGFSFRKSCKKSSRLPSHSSNRRSFSSTCSNRNSTSSPDFPSISTPEDVKGIYTLEQNDNALDKISLKQTSFLEGKSIYKPRLKFSFLESLENKVKASNKDESDNTQPTVKTNNNNAENKVTWRVPRDKLFSGNIYDVEVSMSDNYFNKTKPESISQYPSLTDKSELLNGTKNFKTYASSIKEHTSCEDTFSINPFQSRTLDEYTTGFGELHIDFAIPKLDASDNVTHEEIELPKEKIPVKSQVQKVKPKDFIKAKTLAEKRRLIAEMTKLAKRKPKLSYKLRDNEGNGSSLNSAERVKNQIIKKKHKVNKEKVTVNIKKYLKNQHFDEQGVITYGQEKPLLSVFTKNQLSLNKIQPYTRKDRCRSNKVGMILNVGLNRPLYKEAADNTKMIFHDENCKISKECAGFAVAAVQSSVSGPFKVTRFLVPVAEDYLEVLNLTPKSFKTKNDKGELSSDKLVNLETLVSYYKSVIQEEHGFCDSTIMEPMVLDTVNDIVSYVERKECFEDLEYVCDPDVPAPKEETSLVADKQILKIMERTKKTKLQRQIEHLGCTFISVQSEECCEEDLTPLDNKMCTKDYCKMGCVCYFNLRTEQHCRKSTCMFSCQCSPSSKKQASEVKNKVWLLPDVLRIQSSSQSKLAKVEREYHQTVIMSQDQKTVMIETKHKKRERRIPSKFKDGLILDYKDEENYEIISHNSRLSRNSQSDHGLSPNSKIVSTSPAILPLHSFLGSPSKISKECFVSIEKDDAVQQMATETSFTPRTTVNNNKLHHSKVSKQKSRNVARKKTGAKTFHNFNDENDCSRTKGVFTNYNIRNACCKIRTKDMLLYSANSHSSDYGFNTSSHLQDENDSVVIKEDLQLELYPNDEFQKDEMVCLEKEPNEDGCQLAIGFVCTLPKEVFENQGNVDFEENVDDLHSYLPEDVAESNGKETITDHAYQKDITGSRGKNEKIVYASLPTTKTENKWWVVELDKEKFSSLSFCSDKLILLLDVINNANFMAEYNQKTIKITLNKPINNEAGKFGAYAVPGHKRLIFFGPYELHESHGVTAIKHDKDKYINVPFTTKFKKCDGFKSLGIFQSGSEDDSKNDMNDKLVKAVWWYSTRKKIIVENNNRNVEDEVNQINKAIISRPLASEHLEYINECKNDTKLPQQNTSMLKSVVSLINKNPNILIVDNDSIEETSTVLDADPILQDEISFSDTDENIIQASLKSDDCESNKSMSIVNDIDTEVSQELDVCTNSSDSNYLFEDDFLQVNPRDAMLQNNSESFEEASALITKVQKITKEVIIEKEKDISTKIKNCSQHSILNHKRKFADEMTNHFQHNAKILRLKEKIAGLNNEIVLAKGNVNDINTCQVNRLQETKKFQILPMDFEDDSSSCSDDEFYEEIGLGRESFTRALDELSSPPHKSAESSSVKRIVHKPAARSKSLKSKEEKPGVLPKNLMLKSPSKEPCPERALFCLTQGVGYIAVVEFDHTGLITIEDPEQENVLHQFSDQSQAADWLNSLFAAQFTVKTKETMQWLMVKGTLIRYLQPLNRQIFQFPPKKVEVTQTGIETPMSLKQELRNQLERERRTELAKLLSDLAHEVISPTVQARESRTANITVIKSAKTMIDVQEQMALELSATSLELTRRKSELTRQIKLSLSGIKECDRKKALKLCKIVRNKAPNKVDMISKYMVQMKVLEQKRMPLQKLKDLMSDSVSGTRKKREDFRSEPAESIPSTSQKEAKAPKRPNIPSKSQKEAMAPKRQNRMFGPKPKRKQSSSSPVDDNNPIKNRRPIKDVIELLDSDEDHKDGAVIEIASDNEVEEDVIWIQDRNPESVIDEDIEILCSNVKRRPNIHFPKPKRRRLPLSTPRVLMSKGIKTTPYPVLRTWVRRKTHRPMAIALKPPIPCSSAVISRVPQQNLMQPEFVTVDEEKVETYSGDDSDSSTDPIPANEQYTTFNEFLPLSLSNRINIRTTGLNSIGPLQNSPSTSSFKMDKPKPPSERITVSSVSPKPQTVRNILTRDKPKPPSERINVSSVSPKPQTVRNILPRPSVIQENLFSQASTSSLGLECRNIQPIGKLHPENRFSQFRGKPILLSKSESGFKISKLPSSVLPLSATPVTIMNAASLLSERDNTVTLHHPREQVSETRTVQFRPTNTTSRDLRNILHHPQEEVRETRVVQFRPTNTTSHDLHNILHQPREEVRETHQTVQFRPTNTTSHDLQNILLQPREEVRETHQTVQLGRALATATTSQDRANTVTLYHPSESVSVTRTVQFAPSPALTGPKIRRPRSDSRANIKVLLPKRN